MASILYSTNAAELPRFFEQLRKIGRPQVVDKAFLASLGYKSSSQQSILRVLRVLGFIDDKGIPTERWSLYRDSGRAPFELARAIREAYPSLFGLYPAAQSESDQVLRNFFSSRTDMAENTITHVLRTFRCLCQMASFDNEDSGGNGQSLVIPDEHADVDESQEKSADSLSTSAPRAQEFSLTVNIQLVLPETQDESVYDKVFESMRRHLLTR